MKPGTFYSLVAITAIAAAAAGVAVSMQTNLTTLSAGTEPAFPTLEKNINDAAKIEVKNAKASFSITRNGQNWGLDQKDGYQVEFEKVKSAIVNISNFKLIEKKTSDPDRYSRLEVEEPNSPEAKSRKIVIKTAKGRVLVEAVIGKLNANLFGTGGSGTYLRRGKEKASWLVRGRVELGEEPNNWLARQIVNYGQEKVRNVVITNPNGNSFIISKSAEKQKNFQLKNTPAGRKLKNADELNPLGGVMWRMMFDDVKKAEKQVWPKTPWVAYYSTWSGIRVQIETVKFGEDYWGRFKANVDEKIVDAKKKAAAQKLVNEINARVQGWTYMLTAGDSEKLTSKVADYLAPTGKKGS